MKFAFSSDSDTHKLFEIVVHFLNSYFEYPVSRAVNMVNDYYRAWHVIHDDDFYHELSAFQTSVRIHYFVGLKGEEADFSKWRKENGLQNTPEEARQYFTNNYLS